MKKACPSLKGDIDTMDCLYFLKFAGYEVRNVQEQKLKAGPY